MGLLDEIWANLTPQEQSTSLIRALWLSGEVRTLHELIYILRRERK